MRRVRELVRRAARGARDVGAAAASASVLLSSGDLIERLTRITAEFPAHSIEDGLGENDDDGWIALTARLGAAVELVGDDNFCTNPAIISDAIGRGIANASLIRLNCCCYSRAPLRYAVTRPFKRHRPP